MSFLDRAKELPRLGLGISTEYGAGSASGALCPLDLHDTSEGKVAFLELGTEVHKGLDSIGVRWLERGLPSTYHYLDLNLDDPKDFDPQWVDKLRSLLDQCKPAWLCGDAGLWHFGPREPAHMLLLPPILCNEAASALALGIQHLRDLSEKEVLPENPPGRAFVGDLHLLDFYARVCEEADTGLLLDCAHLAIYQRLMGHSPLHALDRFPLDRVIEVHIAGGREECWEGFSYVEDDHCLQVLPDTWEILDYIAPRAPNLKAVVLECERNPLDEALRSFEDLEERLQGSPFAAGTNSQP